MIVFFEVLEFFKILLIQRFLRRNCNLNVIPGTLSTTPINFNTFFFGNNNINHFDDPCAKFIHDKINCMTNLKKECKQI